MTQKFFWASVSCCDQGVRRFRGGVVVVAGRSRCVVGSVVWRSIVTVGDMYCELLNKISGGSSETVTDDEFVALVASCLAGDRVATQRVFATGARWGNVLAHRYWSLVDPDSEVVTAMWTALQSSPGTVDEWRNSTRRELRRASGARRKHIDEFSVDQVPTVTRRGGDVDPCDEIADRLDAQQRLRAVHIPTNLNETCRRVLADQPADNSYLYAWRRRVAA